MRNTLLFSLLAGDFEPLRPVSLDCIRHHPVRMRIPTKPAMHSNSKPAGYSDLKPATRGVVRMGQIHDVVEGWEGQETGWS